MADSVFPDDLGGMGRQTGSQLPNIGATSDAMVAEDRPGPTIDGWPVTPSVAARRFGAAAGQNQASGNPDPGSGKV